MSGTTDLSHAGAIITRLEEIEGDLAKRQEALEAAAMAWFRAKRDKEHAYAVAYMSAEGPVEQRKAAALLQTSLMGKEEEALWEALRAVVRTLETRATIGMALLKSGRS